jgi:hypothetical protein
MNNFHQVRFRNNFHQVRFRNNFHQVRPKSKYWKAKYLNILRAIKPIGLYRISNIG